MERRGPYVRFKCNSESRSHMVNINVYPHYHKADTNLRQVTGVRLASWVRMDLGRNAVLRLGSWNS